MALTSTLTLVGAFWLHDRNIQPLTRSSVFFAYAFITKTEAILFVNPEQVNDKVKGHLGSAVELRSYDSFFPYLKEFGQSLKETKEPVS